MGVRLPRRPPKLLTWVSRYGRCPIAPSGVFCFIPCNYTELLYILGKNVKEFPKNFTSIIKKPPTLEIGAFHIFHKTHYYERHYYIELFPFWKLFRRKGAVTSPRLMQRSNTVWRALLDTRRHECAS